MKISEKQILQLLRIADWYCAMLHKFGEHNSVGSIQDLLASINDQQSEELKVIE